MTFLFLLLLRPDLMRVDGGSRKIHHIAAALLALPLDVIIAHTTWVFIAGWPKKGEWTISDTLERLCADTENRHWPLFWTIAVRINAESPTHNHIKRVANTSWA
jgi:hypothetical protein